MNRYLIFAGYHYYPSGGWNDFIGSFTRMEECMACLKGRFAADRGLDWAHIVDTSTGGGIDNVFSAKDFR